MDLAFHLLQHHSGHIHLIYYHPLPLFILLDYEQIANGWITLLPKKYQGMALRLTTDIKTSMNRYFRGQALVAFCVGILFSIGFLIIDFPWLSDWDCSSAC